MARGSTRKIGSGAVVVLVCLLLSRLAAAQDCSISTLSGNWSYPSDWCCNFAVTADQATVNPGATATFTIGPPCPGATCTVTSNSGCAANKFTCSLSADGLKASVVVGATACGSLDIAVTKAATASCAQYSASATVRINNTGQGGDWVLVEAYHPDLCCSGCWQCTVLSGNCITGQYRVGAWNNPYGNWSSACNCQPLHPTCEKLADCTKAPGYCVTADCSTVMGGPYGNQHCSLCVWWSWGLWEWKCTCN